MVRLSLLSVGQFCSYWHNLVGWFLLTFLFFHQLSLKSVEEKCENTGECCLKKKKTPGTEVCTDQNVAPSRVKDLKISLETTAQ